MATWPASVQGIQDIRHRDIGNVDTPHKAGCDEWIYDTNQAVMPGLDPGIHALEAGYTWMAGSGPGHDEIVLPGPVRALTLGQAKAQLRGKENPLIDYRP